MIPAAKSVRLPLRSFRGVPSRLYVVWYAIYELKVRDSFARATTTLARFINDCASSVEFCSYGQAKSGVQSRAADMGVGYL